MFQKYLKLVWTSRNKHVLYKWRCSTPPIVRKLSVTFSNPAHTTIRSMLIKCASYLLCRWMFWFWITCILSIRVWNLYCRNCAPQILSHYTLGLSTCSSWMSSHHFHLYVPNVEWEFMLSLYVPCAVPNPLNFIYWMNFQSKAAPAFHMNMPWLPYQILGNQHVMLVTFILSLEYINISCLVRHAENGCFFF